MILDPFSFKIPQLKITELYNKQQIYIKNTGHYICHQVCGQTKTKTQTKQQQKP